MIKKAYFFILLLVIYNLFADENMQVENSQVVLDVKKINEELVFLKNELQNKVKDVNFLFFNDAKDSEYEKLLNSIKAIREKIKDLEENFRKDAICDSMKTDEGYAFWDQGETTIAQLIMEYGSQDFLYVVPQELSTIKLNLFSTIPIPRESFDDILKLILTHNGIGIKKLNPFLHQLYILKQDPSYIQAIINDPKDLNFLDDAAIVCYIISPKIEQLSAMQTFLERFSDLKQTSIQTIKSNIVVIGSKGTLERLINLQQAVFKNTDGKIIRVISLEKVAPQEAEKVLQAFFSQPQKARPSFYQNAIDELSIVVQGSSLILIGESPLVDRAENIISDLEKQLDDPSEMVIFWYTCKHSDPTEIAEVLEKIYFSMSGATIEEKTKVEAQKPAQINANLPVQPKFFEPKKTLTTKESKTLTNNFIADAKTGSILMVVKKDELNKLKSILKKLDEPKKMVQIDVLLVERKVQDRKQTGVNLLKIGSAKNSNETAISFDASSSSKRKGLFDFILSRSKSFIPSFDLTLSFLMAQDDMYIADCPTILAVNQTPATISIVDEISINNGAIQVDTSAGAKFEKAFSRAQFGTTIIMTPTIHLSDDEDLSNGFVTLQTDVSFDTTKSSANDRPAVTRRHIENEVRVANGETIILGGLRRNTGEEGSEKIPFLGEIPGIGKFFGTTKNATSTSEMFIFITPNIIIDPKLDLKQQRQKILEKRQGDIDEFLEKLENAKKQEKNKLFEKSLKLFFEK